MSDVATEPFQRLIQTVLDEGDRKLNRTGIATISTNGVSQRYDLTKGFPAVTTKKLAFKSAVGELAGFLRAKRSASDFRSLGCTVWDQNANENAEWLANPFREGEDDLGDVYGVQWRQWPAYKLLDSTAKNKDIDKFEDIIRSQTSNGWKFIADTSRFSVTGTDIKDVWFKQIDQLRECIEKIILNPDDRRILFHAWNPAKLDEIALPACHLLYQFFPNKETKEISMTMYQRSCDVYLGSPFNVAEACVLLHTVARLTGYTAKRFTHFLGDVHLYENSLDAAKEALANSPYPLPTLSISSDLPTYEELKERLDGKWDLGKLIDQVMFYLDNFDPRWFSLENYQFHEGKKVNMAV